MTFVTRRRTGPTTSRLNPADKDGVIFDGTLAPDRNVFGVQLPVLGDDRLTVDERQDARLTALAKHVEWHEGVVTLAVGCNDIKQKESTVCGN